MSAISDSEDMGLLLLIAVGAYLLYEGYKNVVAPLGTAVSNATTAAGNSVGGTVFSLLNPNAAGESTYYTATVQGTTQNISIPASSVGANGQFTQNGQTYQLYVNNSITSGINKTAVPVASVEVSGDSTADCVDPLGNIIC
jgi:hypothetical protein